MYTNTQEGHAMSQKPSYKLFKMQTAGKTMHHMLTQNQLGLLGMMHGHMHHCNDRRSCDPASLTCIIPMMHGRRWPRSLFDYDKRRTIAFQSISEAAATHIWSHDNCY